MSSHGAADGTAAAPKAASPHEQQLRAQLRALLGDLPPEAVERLAQAMQRVDLPADAVLMRQDDPGDSMYLVVSGRLRAWQRDEQGQDQVLPDMGRGQFIGEISAYTSATRTATVAAVRDTVLARLPDEDFRALLSEIPALSVAMTRQVIHRLRARETHAEVARPVTVALVPVTAGVDAATFAASLQQALSGHGTVCRIDAAGAAAALGLADLSALDAPGNGDVDATRLRQRFAAHLDALEALHMQVLLVAEAQASAWTGLCCQHADEVLLLADAGQPPALHASERAFLAARAARTAATEVLVMLHPPESRCPRGTAAWLARRHVADHLHVRRGDARDMARLARIQSRNAVGLVLAGGGARGLSHLGTWQALRARGIEPDFVGGASIGAVMATLLGADRPEDQTLSVARRAFSRNPTSDYAPWPVLSLIGGQRLRGVVQGALRDLMGEQPDIADLWRNGFVVSSNYTKACETVHERGDLARALCASVAIPGALPPVLIGGELHCDGGSFNNFPVDVMRRRRGVGHVVGVDLRMGTSRRYALDEVPGPWKLLLDRLLPRRRRRLRFPSLLAYLMNTSILYSSSRQAQARQQVDLYLNPPLPRVGMLQWHRFDEIVAKGRAHADEVLAATEPARLAPLRTDPT